MKTDKWRLYLGITLLTLGIILRVAAPIQYLPLIIIFVGVGLKTWHISYLIRQKKYKPGKECWFLAIGLLLFFAGLYFVDQKILKYSLMSVGIAFKAYFVLQLIRKTRD
jgi:hypothetical protein